jgi:hypothetical protein
MHTPIRMLLVLCSGAALLGIAGGTASAGGMLEPVFDPANFPSPPNINDIDNPYWPLPEGRTFIYRSMSKDECQVNWVTVTGQTPSIDGILTREVHDQVWEDDDCDGGRDFLSEDTLDRYAQDDYGNVWYMGEDTAEYCDRDHPTDVCSTEGSWQAGVGEPEPAEPGYVMLADPTAPGTSYPQEYLEDEAEDMAKILRANARVSLTFDNELDQDEYAGCLETKEWSPLERGAIEHKYYCPGVGLVLINELQGGTVRTELVGIIKPPKL